MLAAILCNIQPIGRQGLGGDDRPEDRGWDREEWLARKRNEDAIEQTLKDTYAQIMGTAPVVVKEAATQLVQQFAQPTPSDIPLSIDWQAMAQAYEQIRELTAMWQEEQDRIEEEELFLLQ